MKNVIKNLIILLIGGFIYGLTEIIFRGFTHWSMFLAGGLIFFILYNFFGYIGKGHIILKCLFGCIIITTVEFLTGVTVNILLGLGVWDYSDRKLNLFGQICLLFSIGWFFISIPASFIANFIRRKLDKT